MGAEFFAGAGYASDAARCTSLYGQLSQEYHNAFYSSSNGYYKSGIQTEQAHPPYLRDIEPNSKNQT